MSTSAEQNARYVQPVAIGIVRARSCAQNVLLVSMPSKAPQDVHRVRMARRHCQVKVLQRPTVSKCVLRESTAQAKDAFRAKLALTVTPSQERVLAPSVKLGKHSHGRARRAVKLVQRESG